MDLSDIRLHCGIDLQEYYVKSDKYNQLADSYVRISKENAELRKENKALKQAVSNLEDANISIGNELTEARWALIATNERIKELERIDVEIAVE